MARSRPPFAPPDVSRGGPPATAKRGVPGTTDRRETAAGDRTPCHHCGTPCPDARFAKVDKVFCCRGCLTVYELLIENGLGHFYDLGKQAGVRVGPDAAEQRFRFLDDPVVRDRLLDFADDRIGKVTFQLPTMHCIACVWLLENLFQLRPGIGRSTVNFPRRECAITFEPGRIRLSEVAALLAALGYEPTFNLGTVEARRSDPVSRRLWLRVGVAGFAFGNTMLISVASYLGLSNADHPGLKTFLGFLSLALALPVICYAASDYWRAAWLAVRQRIITLDLPIAAGLAALLGQSAFEVISGRGDGYFDSLTGLVFFLLCGRLFQHKTYDRLAFDRDYRSFFPLSVRRRTSQGEQTVTLSRLAVGDRLVIRHGELIPADARLIAGRGFLDYSFVTGESARVEKEPGDQLYAGGKQLGAALEIETTKPVSQSYLASLWSHEAFRKDSPTSLDTLTNRFSRRFTVGVVLIALAAAGFWAMQGEGGRALKAFISVLIVACPCALALAAPFALGTAQRLLARCQIFLKHPHVLETLARIQTVVFDKTGTLTTPQATTVTFHGEPLTTGERLAVAALASHSTHPYAGRVAASLAGADSESVTPAPPISAFGETAGGGIEGHVGGRKVQLGSPSWLAARGVALPAGVPHSGPATHLALGSVYRGTFQFANVVRPHTDWMLGHLADRYEVALLSGDTEAERERFRAWFPAEAHLRFNQSPLDKLGFIQRLQRAGKRVMMVGDGLNDAGALQQSDVGVAVVEQVSAFSPASDVILSAAQVPRLPAILAFSRATIRVVRVSFGISILYNLVGLSVAAAGQLAPLLCAILMPLSSVTVVTFASVATTWVGRRAGLTGDAKSESGS